MKIIELKLCRLFPKKKGEVANHVFVSMCVWNRTGNLHAKGFNSARQIRSHEMSWFISDFFVFLFIRFLCLFVCLFFSLQIGIGRLTFWILFFSFSTSQVRLHKRTTKKFKKKKLLIKRKRIPPPCPLPSSKKCTDRSIVFFYYSYRHTRCSSLSCGGSCKCTRAKSSCLNVSLIQIK